MRSGSKNKIALIIAPKELHKYRKKSAKPETQSDESNLGIGVQVVVNGGRRNHLLKHGSKLWESRCQ